MYMYVRELTFKSGADFGKAMPTVMKIAAAGSSAFEGRFRLMRPLGGLPWRLRMITESDSFDRAAEQLNKMQSSSEMQALMQEMVMYIDPSKTFDDISQSIG